MAENTQAEKTTDLSVQKKEIASQVLTKINAFMEAGELKLPNDYSPENALKGAMLILEELKDKSGRPLLEVCSRPSVAQALLKMCVEGLSPLKKQGYFIIYGSELVWMRSYQGSLALARRVGGVFDVVPNAIYEADEFEYSIDIETGYKKLIKHNQNIKNIDNSKITGAYALVIYNDGRKDLEVMTMQEIKQAWLQGYAKGNSGAHNNFTQEMCKKTVISRACKTPINSSDDSYLLGGGSPEESEEAQTPLEVVKAQVISETAAETVAFEDIPTKKPTQEKKEAPEVKTEEAPKSTELNKEIKSFSERLAEEKSNLEGKEPEGELKF